MHRPTHRSTLCLLTTAACLLPAALGGCAGYANYPAVGKNDVAVNNPNAAPLPEVMICSLRWVIQRYPVDGPYAINLPAGTLRPTANKILAGMHDENAHLVTPSTQSLPVYHVSKIWIRGERTNVEIIRPVLKPPMGTTPPAADGGMIYQAFNITAEAGWQPWKVTHSRAWPIGSATPPALFGWPEPADASQ